MTGLGSTPVNNRLIRTLPRPVQRKLLASCETIELGYGDVLCETGEPIGHVLFPTGGFISLLTTLGDGARLEVGVVGSEGMHGIALMLGMNRSPEHAVVQGAGSALRMSKANFLRHCQAGSAISLQLHRYVYVLLSQLGQSAGCARYHQIDARLARWLLMSSDRAQADRYHLTQEFLAYMLGVRRAGVTLAAQGLQSRGLIDYSRGDIIILDKAGLEKVSCACYREAKEIYALALGPEKKSSRRTGRIALA